MGKINPEFAQRLREIRKERGLTLEDIENALPITNSAISKWENGDRDIKLSYLKMLAKFLKVPVNWLIGETNDRTLSPKEIAEYGLTSEEVEELLSLGKKLKGGKE